jgi:hypothetical protein
MVRHVRCRLRFWPDDHSFDSGVFSSGWKTVKLAKSGTDADHCKIHGFIARNNPGDS